MGDPWRQSYGTPGAWQHQRTAAGAAQFQAAGYYATQGGATPNHDVMQNQTIFISQHPLASWPGQPAPLLPAPAALLQHHHQQQQQQQSASYPVPREMQPIMQQLQALQSQVMGQTLMLQRMIQQQAGEHSPQLQQLTWQPQMPPQMRGAPFSAGSGNHTAVRIQELTPRQHGSAARASVDGAYNKDSTAERPTMELPSNMQGLVNYLASLRPEKLAVHMDSLFTCPICDDGQRETQYHEGLVELLWHASMMQTGSGANEEPHELFCAWLRFELAQVNAVIRKDLRDALWPFEDPPPEFTVSKQSASTKKLPKGLRCPPARMAVQSYRKMDQRHILKASNDPKRCPICLHHGEALMGRPCFSGVGAQIVHCYSYPRGKPLTEEHHSFAACMLVALDAKDLSVAGLCAASHAGWEGAASAEASTISDTVSQIVEQLVKAEGGPQTPACGGSGDGNNAAKSQGLSAASPGTASAPSKKSKVPETSGAGSSAASGLANKAKVPEKSGGGGSAAPRPSAAAARPGNGEAAASPFPGLAAMANSSAPASSTDAAGQQKLDSAGSLSSRGPMLEDETSLPAQGDAHAARQQKHDSGNAKVVGQQKHEAGGAKAAGHETQDSAEGVSSRSPAMQEETVPMAKGTANGVAKGDARGGAKGNAERDATSQQKDTSAESLPSRAPAVEDERSLPQATATAIEKSLPLSQAKAETNADGPQKQGSAEIPSARCSLATVETLVPARKDASRTAAPSSAALPATASKAPDDRATASKVPEEGVTASKALEDGAAARKAGADGPAASKAPDDGATASKAGSRGSVRMPEELQDEAKAIELLKSLKTMRTEEILASSLRASVCPICETAASAPPPGDATSARGAKGGGQGPRMFRKLHLLIIHASLAKQPQGEKHRAFSRTAELILHARGFALNGYGFKVISHDSTAEHGGRQKAPLVPLADASEPAPSAGETACLELAAPAVAKAERAPVAGPGVEAQYSTVVSANGEPSPDPAPNPTPELILKLVSKPLASSADGEPTAKPTPESVASSADGEPVCKSTPEPSPEPLPSRADGGGMGHGSEEGAHGERSQQEPQASAGEASSQKVPATLVDESVEPNAAALPRKNAEQLLSMAVGSDVRNGQDQAGTSKDRGRESSGGAGKKEKSTPRVIDGVNNGAVLQAHKHGGMGAKRKGETRAGVIVHALPKGHTGGSSRSGASKSGYVLGPVASSRIGQEGNGAAGHTGAGASGEAIGAGALQRGSVVVDVGRGSTGEGAANGPSLISDGVTSNICSASALGARGPGGGNSSDSEQECGRSSAAQGEGGGANPPCLASDSGEGPMVPEGVLGAAPRMKDSGVEGLRVGSGEGAGGAKGVLANGEGRSEQEAKLLERCSALREINGALVREQKREIAQLEYSHFKQKHGVRETVEAAEDSLFRDRLQDLSFSLARTSGSQSRGDELTKLQSNIENYEDMKRVILEKFHKKRITLLMEYTKKAMALEEKQASELKGLMTCVEETMRNEDN